MFTYLRLALWSVELDPNDLKEIAIHEALAAAGAVYFTDRICHFGSFALELAACLGAWFTVGVILAAYRWLYK